jgi:hypothetical protein
MRVLDVFGSGLIATVHQGLARGAGR